MEETLLIKDIVSTLKRFIWLILVLAIVGALAGKLLASHGPAPTYQASSLILLDKQNDKTVLNINQPDDMTRFLLTAQTLVTTSTILNPVKEELGFNMSEKKLSQSITATYDNGSQIMEITAETANPSDAVKIANTTAQVYQKDVKNYLSVKSATIVQRASKDQTVKILHSRTKANIVMGVIIGLVIGLVLAFLLNLFLPRKKA